MNNIIALSLGFIVYTIGFILIRKKSLIIRTIGIIYFVSYIFNITNMDLFPIELDTSPIASIYFSIVTILIMNLINRSNSLFKYVVNWNLAMITIYVIVLCSSLIVITEKLSIVIEIFNSDNLGYLRHMYYQGDRLYDSSKIINYSSIISGYFRVPFLLMSLSLLKTKYSRFVIYLIIISLMPYIFSAIISISRGMIILLFIDLFIIYNYVKTNHAERISEIKTYKLINIPFLATTTILIFFLYKVTLSRFGEESMVLSLIKYFSHSIYFFTSSVSEFENYFLGEFSLNFFFTDGLSLKDLVLKTDTGFFTYLGALFIDFGYAGGPILLFVLFLLIFRFNFSNQYKISKSMLFFFVVQQFFMGVFVWGQNIGLAFILCFIVSRIFKISNN